MQMRWMAGMAALVLVLAACSPLQEPQAEVQHWWDYDDGSSVLASFPEPELSRLSTGPERFIVSRNGVLRGLDAQAARAGDTVVAHHPEAGFAVVETSDPRAYRRIGDIVVRDVVVQWQEPTTTVAFEDDVGDPPFSGSADFFFDLQWGHVPVGATAAWAAGVRGQGVRVAVLDGGFDLTHLDLAPNIDLGSSENFVPGESLQYGLPDPFSHGAHVAGTIAAAQNDFGIIGVAPDAELVLIKVLSDAGSGAFSWVAAGILHAANVGADVANLSLGASIPQSGVCFDDDDCITAREVAELRVLMQRVTNFGTHMGTLYITSAGNSALNRNATADLVVLPADIQRMVAVSATAPVGWATGTDGFWDGRYDHLASYSNYGLGAIDVSAPGGDFVYPTNENCLVAGLLRPCWVFDLVFSTGNGGWYWSAGTSMASPHAAGIAALILSEAGGSGALRPAQLESALYRRSLDLGERGRDPVHGRGAVFSGYER